MSVKAITNSYRILLLIGLFVLPFIYYPKAYVAYEIPKVWFFYFWSIVLTFLALLSVFKGKVTQKMNAVFKTAGAFLLVLVVVSLIGVDFKKSIFGNYYRLDGLLTYFLLFAFSFSLSVLGNKRLLKDLALVSASASFLAALLAIGSKFWPGLPSASGFGQPVFLAGYLAVGFLFMLYLFTKSELKGKIFWSLGILTDIWAVYTTGAIGAFVAIAAGLVIWVILRTKRRLLLPFLAVSFIVGTFMFGVYLKRPADPVQIVYEERQRIIIKTFLGLIEERRIFTGFGVANVDYSFDAGLWPVPVSEDVYLDKAHSTVLEYVLTGGTSGLSAYLLLLLVLFWRLYKTKPSMLTDLYLTLFLVYLVHAQTNVLSIAEEVYFWIALSVGLREE